MSLAYISFQQILIMVMIMAIGLLCAKTGLIDDDMCKKLSNLLLLVVNPLLILLSYQRPFETAVLQGLLLTIFLGFVSFMIAIAASHIVYRNRGDKDYGLERFAAVYPNSAFLGIPLINGIFGTEGVFYLTGYLTVFFIFFWTHGMITMSGKRDFSAIKKALVSPPLLAIFLGFAMFVLRIQLPDIIYTPLALLGGLNTPLAMLVAGASIYGASILGILRDKRIYGLCAMRLLILPALTILALAPFDIPPMIRGVIVVISACPIAINLILFAHRYNRDHLYASQAFAASTILSLGTIPLLLMFL
jgi:predicted permease